MELCIRSLSHWCVLENNHADFHLGWPGFNVDILHSSHSSNPLVLWRTRALFSHGRMYGLTDWWQWNMQVVSVLIQTAVSSACRANTLERCAVTRSEVVLPQVTTPLLFSIIFWSRVDSSFLWLVVSLFVTFISFCMIWKKCPDMLFSVSFKLHGGWLPSFRLAPCCFWNVTDAATYTYVLEISGFLSPFLILLVSSASHFLPSSNNYVISCGHEVSEWPHLDITPGSSHVLSDDFNFFELLTLTLFVS